MKINVSIQKTKFIRVVRHARKFRLHTDASRVRGVHARWIRNYPRVIAERAIHHVIVMDGRSFGQSQWNLLLTS